MTTIAFDGKTLAADTLWQSAYRQQHDTPKIRRRGGLVWGTAGDASDGFIFDEWLADGMPKDKKPTLSDKDGFVALVVENGVAYRYEGALVRIPAGVPAATGSGCEIAMGAMMAGASAKRAVEIAIKLNSGSGGKVRTLNCAKR